MLLLSAEEISKRGAVAGTQLRGLADSLAHDLDRILHAPIFIPPEKARLTRIGGRCPTDGAQLMFDPFSPHEHACPQCHQRYREAEHYRWWIMFYQLWLAERAVHAAALYAVRGDDRHRAFAEDVLGRYAASYHTYPNSDNVLGPSRLFFSTYLESIWLLQLCVALDLLEMRSAGASVVGLLRDCVIAPASTLIAGYDEGDSNRQVWNNAALMASARLLGQPDVFDEVVNRRHGLSDHLNRALLADGSWYEGENYHQFAHRGLWYGVAMAEAAGTEIPPTLVSRFNSAFAAPFLTALPDFTFPSRRDSPHRVSLRQWRYAESCELGLSRHDDDRLLGALHTLYNDDLPRGDSGRWRSAAESERNEPPTRLTRADLGWRSLLCARADLPKLQPASPGSVLLESQGLAVLRRDHGRIYVALDYGHSGGGHGHPDRLNLLLVDGDRRWLDDWGTGSYVDPTLHWYRSSLAHNAPMFNGQTQQRVAGTLIAHEDRGGAGWVRARASNLAEGSQATRTVVVMPDYVVDVIDWETTPKGWLDLPLHITGEPRNAAWDDIAVDQLDLGNASAFLRAAAKLATDARPLVVDAHDAGADLQAWLITSAPLQLLKLVAPGPPGSGDRAFLLTRCSADRGSLTVVWSPRGSVTSAATAVDGLTVELGDGSRHTHRLTAEGWHIELHTGSARSSIDLIGVRPVIAPRPPERRGSVTPPRGASQTFPVVPRNSGGAEELRWVVFQLGEPNYRRSEQTWSDAGAPTAEVRLAASGEELLIDIAVNKGAPTFAAAREWNDLDNERPDINSDGVQLYLRTAQRSQPSEERESAWLLVPEPGGSVRVTHLETAANTPLAARWTRTLTGYTVHVRIEGGVSALAAEAALKLEVIVNEISPERERRRGQLVLTGGHGEFIYLRGDRHSGRWVTLRIADA